MEKEKPTGIDIVQIVVKDSSVLGLGNDSLVYNWNHTENKWTIFVYDKENPPRAIFMEHN